MYKLSVILLKYINSCSLEMPRGHVTDPLNYARLYANKKSHFS